MGGAMRNLSQLPLPLRSAPALSRADLIVAPANARAVAFIDAWPDWPVAAAALFGPTSCGKSHLISIWCTESGARSVAARELAMTDLDGPLAIEDVDGAQVSQTRDTILFAALNGATHAAPLLLTGSGPPASWPCVVPDLASRFAALVAFPLWAPDEALLSALARKLFADRQLDVPDAVIAQMLRFLERSPSAMRDFVARADAAALAQSRPVNLTLVRELLSDGPADAR
jgi:chromosomal replication initiation ATPase DnaA